MKFITLKFQRLKIPLSADLSARLLSFPELTVALQATEAA
jgi:hypothetical protein